MPSEKVSTVRNLPAVGRNTMRPELAATMANSATRTGRNLPAGGTIAGIVPQDRGRPDRPGHGNRHRHRLPPEAPVARAAKCRAKRTQARWSMPPAHGRNRPIPPPRLRLTFPPDGFRPASGCHPVLASACPCGRSGLTSWLISCCKFGAPDRIRTCDLCLRRAALYPAELRVLERLYKGPQQAVQCFVAAGRQPFRAAFSAWPDVPSRRASSARTAFRLTPDAVSMTTRW